MNEERPNRTNTDEERLQAPSLALIFLWHMHQPDYRDRSLDCHVLPWTYLHGIKDYTDMADHLERHPALHAVVNFAPVLLEQMDEYADQISRGDLHDPLLRLLALDHFDQITDTDRTLMLDACFRCNHPHMLEPFAPYRRLRDLARVIADTESPNRHLGSAYYADLITWYHLAWTGESTRRHHPWLLGLIAKGADFSRDDRARLLALIGQELARLTPRYRALAARGQIELSTTPYAHPLGPLLIDFMAGRDALPDLPLPSSAEYAGGSARFTHHCTLAKAAHVARFAVAPAGVWPAEGAISAPVLTEFARQSFTWTASGEAVLINTLQGAQATYHRETQLYRPWRDASGMTLFFRDDRLSDLIGFEYARWDAGDAVRHFIAELRAIRHALPVGETPVVCVALDGENAWEYYPYNAYYFFDALYSGLSAEPWIETTTFSATLAATAHQARMAALPPVCAGSWVHGTLATWIGAPDKNRAWDLLCTAKTAYDRCAHALPAATRTRAEALLTVCEGSDWFWWLGDYNPATSVANFEGLFRANLRALYDCLGVPIPPALEIPLSYGSIDMEEAGTMRRAQLAT